MVTQFSLGRYLAADGTWTYLQNILLVTRYELPGVFTGNIYPDVVNGSLWTLPLEVLMYIGVMILGLTGFLKRRLIFLPIVVLAVGHFWLLGKLGIESYFIKNIFKLGLLYYSGSALFLYRDDILAWLDRGAVVRRAGGDLPHRHRSAGVLRRAAVSGALPGLRAAAADLALRQVRRFFLWPVHLRLPVPAADHLPVRPAGRRARPDADRLRADADPRRAVLAPDRSAGDEAQAPVCLATAAGTGDAEG